MINIFICHPKCSTCNKARRWLDEHNIAYEERNIKEQNPTEKELRDWVLQSELKVKKFFNTSGALYRSLGLSKRLPEMDESEQFKILATDGMLVKRPILLTEDKVLVGFKESEWDRAF